jgi:hypothetical protein
LGRNLQAIAGFRPPGSAAHHIVGSGRRSKEAKSILEKHGININSPLNGVFLPNCKRKGKTSTASALHCGGHSGKYFDEVNDRIRMADMRGGKHEVIDELNKVKEDLLLLVQRLN